MSSLSSRPRDEAVQVTRPARLPDAWTLTPPHSCGDAEERVGRLACPCENVDRHSLAREASASLPRVEPDPSMTGGTPRKDEHALAHSWTLSTRRAASPQPSPRCRRCAMIRPCPTQSVFYFARCRRIVLSAERIGPAAGAEWLPVTAAFISKPLDGVVGLTDEAHARIADCEQRASDTARAIVWPIPGRQRCPCGTAMTFAASGPAEAVRAERDAPRVPRGCRPRRGGELLEAAVAADGWDILAEGIEDRREEPAARGHRRSQRSRVFGVPTVIVAASISGAMIACSSLPARARLRRTAQAREPPAPTEIHLELARRGQQRLGRRTGAPALGPVSDDSGCGSCRS